MELIIALVIILILLVVWLYYYKPTVYQTVHTYLPYVTPAAPTERFNPQYDRTFTQSVYDHQLDKAQDAKGNTVDDYMLGDLLTSQHSA